MEFVWIAQIRIEQVRCEFVTPEFVCSVQIRIELA